MKIKITPEMAMTILENNTNNRPLNNRNLRFLESEIRSGRFSYNGETIIIGNGGVLLDGQHRLQACINTGIDIEVELIDGVCVDAFKTIDTGRVRNAGDVFNIEGITRAKDKSSASRAIITKLDLKFGTNVVSPSNEEIFNMYMSHREEIDEYSDMVCTLYAKYKIHPIAQAIAMIFLLNRVDEKNRGKEYIRQVFTGVQEGVSNIPILIRDKFIQDAFSKTKTLPRRTKRDILINGFYAYCKERKYERLSMSAFKRAVL